MLVPENFSKEVFSVLNTDYMFLFIYLTDCTKICDF